METLIATLPYIQIILAILMVSAILVQKSASGAGMTFGGNDNWSSGYHTRRGFEKFIFNATIVLGVLFAVTSFLALLVK